jgi:2-keto-4-pentenoate hydratase
VSNDNPLIVANLDWQPSACALQLFQARQSGTNLESSSLEGAPRSVMEAYQIQNLILDLAKDTIGGWKVGAKGLDSPINGSLLPARGIYPSGVNLPLNCFTWVGLELEIGFLLSQDFPVRARPYSEDEVLNSIEWMLPTIELVTSRISPNSENPRHWAVADLLNHGALITGSPIAYDPKFPFLLPHLNWQFNGENIAPATPPSNPAGDPRRLLTWTVNHCCQQGWDFKKNMLITAGTYTGVFKPRGKGEAIGVFTDLGEVRLQLL